MDLGQGQDHLKFLGLPNHWKTDPVATAEKADKVAPAITVNSMTESTPKGHKVWTNLFNFKKSSKEAYLGDKNR